MSGRNIENGYGNAKILVLLLIISFLLITIIPSIAQEGIIDNNDVGSSILPEYSRYIIVFNDSNQASTLSVKNGVTALINEYDGRLINDLGIINGISVELPNNKVSEISSINGVKYILEDQISYALLDQAVVQIGADDVWLMGYTGNGVKVCVIDSGIDTNHPDLSGKVVGWVDYVNNYNSPYDDNGHGTHCAGTIAGTGAASGGVYKGVAYGASLLGAKVLDSSGSGYDSDIIAAIQWADANHAKIISMSLGGGHYQPLDDAINVAVSHGIIVVVAAGNSGPNSYTIECPGDNANAITVGAVDRYDYIASFSSRGPTSDGRIKPDVTNMGVGLIAPRANPYGSYYVAKSGTSMATPMTAGVVALMLEKNPGLTPAQVKSNLTSTALHLGSGIPNSVYGYGRVQALNAIQSITYDSTIQISSASYSKLENGGTVTITVVAMSTVNSPIYVNYATMDGTAAASTDYTEKSGTLIFNPGETQKTITVNLIDDNVYEGTETFSLLLTSISNNGQLGTPSTATITIQDNEAQPSLKLTSSTYWTYENRASIVFNVSLTGPINIPSGINFYTSNGTAVAGIDYAFNNGTLNFDALETSKTFTVNLINDAYYEPNETFYVNLSNPFGGILLGSPAVGTVTIGDDDAKPIIRFTPASYTVMENGSFVILNLSVIGSAATSAAINFSTKNGTALAGVDYQRNSGVLTVNPDDAEKSIIITLINDTLNETTKTLYVTLSSSNSNINIGTENNTTVNILDDDYIYPVRFMASSINVSENITSIELSVALTGTPGAIGSVNFTTRNGTASAGLDFIATNGALNFGVSDTTKTITINIIDDAAFELNETFYVDLSGLTGNIVPGSPMSVNITVLDNDPKPVIQFSPVSYDISEGAGTAIVNLAVVGSAQSAIYLNYTTSNGTAYSGSDYTKTTGTLIINPGEFGKTINVGIVNNAIYENNETFNVTLINASSNAVLGAEKNATVNIIDDDVKPGILFSAPTYSVFENKTSIQLNVTLNGPIGVPAMVNYTTVNGTAMAGVEYVRKNGTLTFNTTDTMKTINISMINDVFYEANKSFFVVLSDPSWNVQLGSPFNATVNVMSEDPLPVIRFTSATYNVLENAGNAIIGISITGASESSFTVDYATSDGTAHADTEYTNTHGTLTIPKGMTSTSFTVPVMNDTDVDGNKALNITLSGISGNAVLGTPSQATLNILDDEGISLSQLQLNRGWNMVSLPVINDTIHASDFNGTEVIIIAVFNRTTLGFDSYLIGISSPDEDMLIQPDYGYLLYCMNDMTYDVVGLPPAGRGVDIYRGWNMIGWSSLTPSNASAVCAMLPGDQIVARYNGTTYGFDSYLEGISNSDESFDISPGEGYYLYSFNTETLRLVYEGV